MEVVGIVGHHEHPWTVDLDTSFFSWVEQKEEKTVVEQVHLQSTIHPQVLVEHISHQTQLGSVGRYTYHPILEEAHHQHR